MKRIYTSKYFLYGWLLFYWATSVITVNAQSVWNGSGTAWLTSVNWTPSGAPATTAIAQFNAAGSSPGINMNGSTNNGANNQAVGAVQVTNLRGTFLNIGNSSTTAAGTFTLNGATVNSTANEVVSNESGQNLNIQQNTGSGTAAMVVALGNATENIFSITGAGNITVSIPVQGANPLTKTGTGTGVLTLTAVNTYTGLTTVSEGTLRLNAAAGGTLPATNNATINGGTLRVSTNQTLNNITLTSGTLTVDAGVTLTVTGTFTVTGGTVSNNGTIAYATGSNLLYNGSTLQTTGGELPVSPATVYNLTIDNTSNVRMNNNATVANQLTINTGSFNLFGNTLTLAGLAPSIAAGGSINAFANAASKVVFANTSPITLPAVTFTSGNTANNLEMNGAGGVTLSSNLNVAIQLTLSSGKMTLGANNLVIGAAGSITGGSSSSYAVTDGTGVLTIPNVGAAAVLFPVGPSSTLYHPATITNSGTADAFSVNVASALPSCFSSGVYSVNAVWDISESIAGGSNCTLVLDYAGATVGGSYSAGLATIAHCNGATSDYKNGTVTGTVATGSGFTVFSPFGITNDPVVLPVNLISFSARKIGEATLVNWETVGEQNTKGFQVQRSADGIYYSTVGFINAKGPSSYTFRDILPYKGNNFYRLRIIDNDGKEEFSKVQVVSFEGKPGIARVYPTITNDKLYILRDTKEALPFVIVNMTGHQMLNGLVTDNKELSVKGLPSGSYILKIGNQSFKFIRK